MQYKLDSDTNSSFIGIDASTMFSQDKFNFAPTKKNTCNETKESNNTQKTDSFCSKEENPVISKEKVIYRLKRDNRLCLNKIEALTEENLLLKAQIEELKRGQNLPVSLPSNSLSVATPKQKTQENKLAITNQS